MRLLPEAVETARQAMRAVVEPAPPPKPEWDRRVHQETWALFVPSDEIQRPPLAFLENAAHVLPSKPMLANCTPPEHHVTAMVEAHLFACCGIHHRLHHHVQHPQRRHDADAHPQHRDPRSGDAENDVIASNASRALFHTDISFRPRIAPPA
jgi:hypothetical protein